MNTHKKAIRLTVWTLVALFGLTSIAVAGMGRGMGHGQRGTGAMGPYAPGLTAEQMQAVVEARQAFFTDTADLRQQLREKRLELASVLIKPKPDLEAARAVQKSLSDIQAQLDQKRIEHVIQMKEINPHAGAGMMMGGGMGWGGCGRGMGMMGGGMGRGGCARGMGMMGGRGMMMGPGGGWGIDADD